MPFPYTKYRSRNRTRVNNKIPPLVSSVAGPSGINHTGGVVTFPSAMDTTVLAIPAGFTIAGHQVITFSWTNATTAAVTTGVTLAAADAWVFPATNVLRSVNGGNVRGSTGVLS